MILGCVQTSNQKHSPQSSPDETQPQLPARTYDEINQDIARKKTEWSASATVWNDSVKGVIIDFWIYEISVELYVIGLHFYTEFIVNDGQNNWFTHSNYIGQKGVTKELVVNSAALQGSKTKWLVSLFGDKQFLFKWAND